MATHPADSSEKLLSADVIERFKELLLKTAADLHEKAVELSS
jgi:hypothetical protein